MSVLNQCPASPSGKQQLARDPDCASVSAKKYLPLTASQPQSNPNFILTPEKISSRYSPKLARRMETDECFKCKKKGHWMVDCPLNSPDADYTKIHCRCGHGFCEVKTARNNRNNGRKYYACPIKRGKRCGEFVRWCDDPVRENDLHPPPYKYPECARCGAGVCKKEKEMSGPNAGRYYFSCPVGEGFGSCGFITWEDTLLNSTSIVPVRRSIQKNLHDYWDQIKTTNNNDKEEGSELNLGDSKRMRIMDNSVSPNYSFVSPSRKRGYIPKGSYDGERETR
ncbi:hypothetical protein L6164_009123 [Bauhinia variegata]|uniref:Uncharacterized protein n=1 Tax=Bauhinia variegata TaxID=167791 RepID=A0ACB9PIY4_BAUVA|nr:hypothetical protein L6164_009123 [Bauhinia variegata]